MTASDVLAAVLLGGGCFFFIAGTIGLLRFPDVFCRLHALTKADNLGLGLVLLALVVRSGSLATAARLAVVWVLVLLASTTACHLVARSALQQGSPHGRRP